MDLIEWLVIASGCKVFADEVQPEHFHLPNFPQGFPFDMWGPFLVHVVHWLPAAVL